MKKNTKDTNLFRTQYQEKIKDFQKNNYELYSFVINNFEDYISGKFSKIIDLLVNFNQDLDIVNWNIKNGVINQENLVKSVPNEKEFRRWGKEYLMINFIGKDNRKIPLIYLYPFLEKNISFEIEKSQFNKDEITGGEIYFINLEFSVFKNNFFAETQDFIQELFESEQKEIDCELNLNDLFNKN